jgi:hypothetical protein
MDMGKEIIKTNGYKFVLDAFQFVGSSRHNGNTNTRSA